MDTTKLSNKPGRVEVTASIPTERFEAFNLMLDDFYARETPWDREIQSREDRQAKGVESLKALLDFALSESCGGSRVVAGVLASLYNGSRFKVDLTDLRLLDSKLHEHVMNVLVLDHAPKQEVHTYFDNGGRIFEDMFKDYGLFDHRAGKPAGGNDE